METEIGREITNRFPELTVTEDVMSSQSYWVNIRLGSRWLVIEKTTERGIGLSEVKGGLADFGGHDQVVNEISEAISWVEKQVVTVR